MKVSQFECMMKSVKHNTMLNKEQHQTLVELFVERVVDNMSTKDLAIYVTDDMLQCFSSMPQTEVLENMYSYYDEEFINELIEEVKEID